MTTPITALASLANMAVKRSICSSKKNWLTEECSGWQVHPEHFYLPCFRNYAREGEI
jgi:hypothetical protein